MFYCVFVGGWDTLCKTERVHKHTVLVYDKRSCTAQILSHAQRPIFLYFFLRLSKNTL